MFIDLLKKKTKKTWNIVKLLRSLFEYNKVNNMQIEADKCVKYVDTSVYVYVQVTWGSWSGY